MDTTGRHSVGGLSSPPSEFGLPLGVACLRPGIAKTEINRGRREILPKIGADRLVASQRRHNLFEVVCLEFGNHRTGHPWRLAGQDDNCAGI